MNNLLNRHWDVIIVGTGMGGATLGRAMAEQGRSVLFLEKGRRGFRSERQGLSPDVADPLARMVRGFWPDRLEATVNGQRSDFFAPLGCGVGGSSVFYAGTLERPEPHDLDDAPGMPHPVGGWPCRWQEMVPWYEKAEAMYRVHDGSRPPDVQPSASGEPATELHAEDAAIMRKLRANGHQPSLLHSSIVGGKDCLECRGTKCPRVCKMDARSAGIEPALASGNAAVIDECEVVAFRGDARRVTHVEADHGGQRLQLRADTFVLSAGALGSPRLLLASRSEHWPQGCGNAHDQVGRHLMFHLNEMFAIWSGASESSDLPSKSVGLRDLYTMGGHRMGMIQAMGINVNYGEIVHFLRERLRAGKLSPLAPLTPLAAGAAYRLLGRAKLFVGLLEDLPYADNRVYLDPARPSRIRLDYTIHDELLQRRQLFRKGIQRAFRGMRPVFANWQPELNYGHPCGTLRAGSDPRTSVLNGHCRLHDVDNLHVVDASFFPTSMGVNPSLTIAANALRVANHLLNSP
jgi:choline dehydrogenase-like flavoprotein